MSITTQLNIISIGFLLISVTVYNGIHKIDEGHIGVYYRGGALLTQTAEPGYHVKLPYLTKHENVQVTVQTDKVKDIPCGTMGGVLIYFDQVEVVNRLKKEHVYQTIKNYTIHYDKTWIFDKIHHEINQFCSKSSLQEVYIDKFDTLDEQLVQTLQEDCNKWAPGIQIISIRVSKPRIPDSLLRSYELIEQQKTKYLIQEQEQRVKLKQSETKKIEEKIQAESEAEVSKIEMEKLIQEKESYQKMEQIKNQILYEKEKSIADANYYKISKMIEAEQKQLTPEYLKKLIIESFGNKSKVYYGDSIPDFIEENINQVLNN